MVATGIPLVLVAARELAKLLAAGDDTQRWAEIHAKQARIVAAFREVVPPQYHQAIMDKLEGRTPPAPGPARLALIEGGVATDEEFDAGEEDDEDDGYDDED